MVWRVWIKESLLPNQSTHVNYKGVVCYGCKLDCQVVSYWLYVNYVSLNLRS